MPPTLEVHYGIDMKEADRLLTGLERALAPWKLVDYLTHFAAPYLRDRAEARFKRQGDDRSGRWAPLAERTKRDRRSKGFAPSRPINVRTGALHDLVVGDVTTTFAGTAGFGFDAGATMVMPRVGAPTELEDKLRVAQQGLDPNPIGGAKPVPARPVLAVNDRDADMLARGLDEWLRDVIVTYAEGGLI